MGRKKRRGNGRPRFEGNDRFKFCDQTFRLPFQVLWFFLGSSFCMVQGFSKIRLFSRVLICYRSLNRDTCMIRNFLGQKTTETGDDNMDGMVRRSDNRRQHGGIKKRFGQRNRAGPIPSALTLDDGDDNMGLSITNASRGARSTG